MTVLDDARRTNGVQAQCAPNHNSEKSQNENAARRIGRKSVHGYQHTGSHQEGSEQGKRKGNDGQQNGPGLQQAPLLGDRQRMNQRRAHQPGHERRVFNRVPEPPSAPAQFVISPP